MPNEHSGHAVHSAEEPDVFLGIDAGGTRTRSIVVDGRRRVIGRGTAGAGNALSVPGPLLAEHLAAAVAEALPPSAAVRLRGVTAGFAGVSWLLDEDPGRAAAVEALRVALGRLPVPAGVPIDVRSDQEVAFASGPGTPSEGLLALSGTGSAVTRFEAGRVVATVDAHGWMLDDAGSGHWIGRHTGRAVLRALDGRGAWTSLVPSVTALLTAPVERMPAGREERERVRAELLRALIAGGPLALARLCPLAVRAADGGDEVAAGVLDDAVRALLASVHALDPVPGETLVTTGGLLGPDGPLLVRMEASLEAIGLRPLPVPDGTSGAAALALRLAGAGRWEGPRSEAAGGTTGPTRLCPR